MDFPPNIDSQTRLGRITRDRATEFLALIDTCRPYLRQWLGWLDQTRSLEDLLRFIDSTEREFDEGKGVALWIWQRDQIVGIIHLREIDRAHRKAMIGYWIAEAFRGQGLAKKATKAVCDYAFGERKLNRVEIRCATENLASQAVPLALGFTREGILRDNEWLYDHFVDHVVFGMLARDWGR